MLKTYKAIINNDRLHWLEEKPNFLKHTQKKLVYVTVLDNNPPDIKKNNDTLVDFFMQSPLYASDINLDRDQDFGREVVL